MNRILLAFFFALVGACATTPTRNDSLEEARAEIDRASADPLAQQAAGKDIEEARTDLQLADSAFQQRRPPQEVDHLAYLALRHAQAAEARIAEAHARQQVAQAQEERTRIQMEAREREVRNARNAAENARNSATVAQGEAATAQGELARARQELQDLQAKQTARGMVMTLSDVLFDTGQATLKPGADRAIDRLAQYLKDSPGTHAIIEGHTDSVGSDDYNLALSQRRAQAVADALTARGVSADRIQAKGLGKAYPVASNDTQAGRQQNRRVEIVFSDESGRFTQTSP